MIKINTCGTSFLVPVSDDENWLDEWQENKPVIQQLIDAVEKLEANPLNGVMQQQLAAASGALAGFAKRTGVIGYPFTLHDVEMYIVDRSVTVELEIEL